MVTTVSMILNTALLVVVVLWWVYARMVKKSKHLKTGFTAEKDGLWFYMPTSDRTIEGTRIIKWPWHNDNFC